MSDLPTGVSKFRDQFNSHVELIRSLSHSQEWEVLQKSLYVAVIDSIGAVIFAEDGKYNNQRRFRKTILEFAKWPHATYFSLPYLHQYLTVKRDKFFKQLETQLVNPRYELWIDTQSSRRFSELPWIPVPNCRQVLSLDADVSESHVLALIRQGDQKKVNKIAKFQHCSLLYEYRTFLVHSLTIPGLNDRPEQMNYPYYEEYGVVDPETGREELYYNLVYSSEFLYTLCRRVIENAAEHMRTKGIDPYIRMQASIACYWDHELNAEIGTLGQQMVSSIRAHPRRG